ncbi:MAG: hypothetical protein ACI8T1_004505 [Verrucomicrobiales bacterium]|jgi:hypothetical protein
MITRCFLGLLALLTLCSCQTGGGGPLVQARNERIRQEPLGDYFMGRRYWVKGSRTWGWVRKPGQPWDKARLVVTNERFKKNPDRLPEYRTDGGPTNGSDHNVEYQLKGYFSGDEVYDPTTNLILPEFVLQGYEITNREPGWLFQPNDRLGNSRLPRTHVTVLGP